MKRVREALARLLGSPAARRREADLRDEIRAHLELLADEHVRRGLSPEDALRAARRDFGSTARTTERYREQGRVPFVDSLAQDVRHAFRLWRSAPGFSAVVITILALGIGVNSAMFTLVNALLLKPLAGRGSELVGLYSHDSTTPNSYRIFSYPNFADIRAHNDVFDGLIAYTFSRAGKPAGDLTEQTSIEVVSADFFSTIGVSLAAGRGFSPEEDRPGAGIPVAIASYTSWEKAGLTPAFVGSTIRLNTTDFTIIGVAPKGFTGTTAIIAPEVWLPIGVFESIVTDRFKNNGLGLTDRTNTAFMVAGILKPGVSASQANERLAVLSEGLAREYPAENKNQVLTVFPLSRVNVSSIPSSDSGPELLSGVLLMPLSGAVLLIACLNIANMLLARGSARKKEIAIRLALGGGRSRIVRQLLTESLVLAVAGAVSGLTLAWSIGRIFTASLEGRIPFPLQFSRLPDRNVIIATLGFAIVSTLAFGLAPALKITRLDLVDDLKDLGGSRQARRLGMREWLVVCQIAVSLMLMTAGGLFARAALKADVTDPGYGYDHLLLASVDPALAGYDAQKGRQQLLAALERLRSLPDVAAASAISQVPFGDEHESRAVSRPGEEYQPRRAPAYTVATSDYFKSIGLPILRGRDFSQGEEASASRQRVAIIDEPLARSLFANENPVGQQVMVYTRRAPTDENDPMTIVGIVPGIRDELTDRDPQPHLYVPASVGFRGAMHLHVRTTGVADARMLDRVRQALRAVDERLPIVELQTMGQFHERSLLLWVIHAAGLALSGLGGLALLLASIGVYGVKSYVVSQRTREIGIRLALGATPREIGWMLLRDGARITLVGVAIGFPLAVALGRLLGFAIFEVSPFDPLVLTIAPLVLCGIAAVATYVPARRGMRVSPLVALRTE